MVGTLPEILIGVVVVLVLSASMSTLSSLVLTSSSTITLDLIIPMRKNGDEKKTLIIMRALIAVFLLVSVIIALNKNNLISDLMGYSWGALAGAFLAPMLLGLFRKGITRAGVWASLIWGIGATAVHFVLKSAGVLSGTLLGFNLASPVNLGAFTMVMGLIIVPIVSLITPKLKKSDIERIFSCYDKKVEVSHVVALTENEGQVTLPIDNTAEK